MFIFLIYTLYIQNNLFINKTISILRDKDILIGYQWNVNFATLFHLLEL